MSTVAGRKRETATAKRMKSTTEALRKRREQVGRRLTQRACTQCDPTEWVRIADWEIHRANYHRAGGYQYEQRKARAEQAKVAEKAQAEAAKQAAKAAPPRPERPASKTKPTAASTRGPVGARASSSRMLPVPESITSRITPTNITRPPSVVTSRACRAARRLAARRR